MPYDGSDGPSWAVMLVPITAIAMFAVVLIMLMYFRYRERAKLHDTLRVLAQAETPNQAELLSVLTKASVPQPDRDLRMAIIMFGSGLGLLAMGFMIGMMEGDEPYEVIWPLVAIAVFPIAFGVGRFLLWRMAVKRGDA